MLAQRLERPRSMRQPLALAPPLSDEHTRHLARGRRRAPLSAADRRARALGTLDNAPRRTAGPFHAAASEHRYAHVQPVNTRLRAEDVRDPVREPVLVVGVERPDQQAAGPVGRDPDGSGAIGSCDVYDVVTARAQLLVQRRNAVRRDRQIRHRAVRLEADRAAEETRGNPASSGAADGRRDEHRLRTDQAGQAARAHGPGAHPR